MKCYENVLFSDGVWRDAYITSEMKQQFARDRLKEKLTDEK
jgi:hypothetical protein